MSVTNLNAMSYLYITDILDTQNVSTGALLLNGLNPYTAFHEIAQMNIAKKLSEMGYATILEYPIYSKTEKTWWGGSKKYEADIVAGADIASMVWEVKPVGTSGLTQLNKYVENSNLMPGFIMDPILNIPVIGDYKMGINFTGEGLANYFFYKNDPDERVESVEVAKAFRRKQAGATLAAAGILGLGVADDITGIGVADDPAALALALSAASAILAG